MGSMNAQKENKDKPGEIEFHFLLFHYVTRPQFEMFFTPIGGPALWKKKNPKKQSGGAPGAPGVTAERGGGKQEEEGEGLTLGASFLKARFSPDTSVLFINSFSRAVKNQCALHCKQFIMTGRDGGGGEEGKKRKEKKKEAQLQQN